MIPDDPLLQNVGMSPHLLSAVRNIIAYFPEFEGNRVMNFGNVRMIERDRIHVGISVFQIDDWIAEWNIFQTASSSEEAVLKCRRHFLLKEIGNREKALANAKKGVETQERRLAELRAQLEETES